MQLVCNPVRCNIHTLTEIALANGYALIYFSYYT